MHSLHLDTQWNGDDTCEMAEMGFNYVTSLDVVYPIHTLCVALSSASYSHENGGSTAYNFDEERDVDLCCVQTILLHFSINT